MPETFPIDAVPNNGWVMELPGMTSPHITKVSGISKHTGQLSVVDGGSNREFHFSDGIIKHTPITITRIRDNSPEDKKFAKFFEDAVNGGKITGTLIQTRNGKPCCKIKFQGLLMNDLKLHDFDVHGSDPATMEYVAQCDWADFDFGADAA